MNRKDTVKFNCSQSAEKFINVLELVGKCTDKILIINLFPKCNKICNSPRIAKLYIESLFELFC